MGQEPSRSGWDGARAIMWELYGEPTVKKLGRDQRSRESAVKGFCALLAHLPNSGVRGKWKLAKETAKAACTPIVEDLLCPTTGCRG